MATLYISEYSDIYGRAAGGPAQAAIEPAIAEQNVAIGGSSVQSAAFNASTRLIRVHADATCSVAIGSNPTAVATAKRMAAGATEYFAVTAAHKIAVITNS